MNDKWIRTCDDLPKTGEVVETKVDDADGGHNLQNLKIGGMHGNIWFFPDGSMYVYYNPTHWRRIKSSNP